MPGQMCITMTPEFHLGLFSDPPVSLGVDFSIDRNDNAPSKRGVVYNLGGLSNPGLFLVHQTPSAYCSAVAALISSSSNSNTSTELAGIAGVGLCSPYASSLGI